MGVKLSVPVWEEFQRMWSLSARLMEHHGGKEEDPNSSLLTQTNTTETYGHL